MSALRSSSEGQGSEPDLAAKALPPVPPSPDCVQPVARLKDQSQSNVIDHEAGTNRVTSHSDAATIAEGVLTQRGVDIHTDTGRSPSLLQTSAQQNQGRHASNTSTKSAAASRPPFLQDIRFGRIDLLSTWFPDIDPAHPKARTSWKNWHTKQDVLLTTAASTSILVLLVNVAATIYVQTKYEPTGGVVPMYEGSCSLVRDVDTYFHLGINALSTLLLGASNLCMQVLMAPTRKEIDAAHKKRRWLDVGVPSIRNFKSIGIWRRVMWCLLGLSSVPLHFIYNSAISGSLPCYGYAGATVTEKFLHGGEWGDAAGFGGYPYDFDSYSLTGEYYGWPEPAVWNANVSLQYMQQHALDGHTLAKLLKKDCLDVYTNMYGARTNMMIVVEDGPTYHNSSLLEYTYRPASIAHSDVNWLCYNGDTVNGPVCYLTSRNNETRLDNWYKFDRKVLYCLVETKAGLDEHCRLNYSPAILIAICCLSFFKCLGIGLTAFIFHKSKETPLCTLGDAIDSFLDSGDSQTSNMGIITKCTVDRGHVWKSKARAVVWNPTRETWFTSASKRRWSFTVTMFAAAILAAVVSLATGASGTLHRLQVSRFAAALQLGFGKANAAAFTAYFLPNYGSRGFILNVIWANIWQMVISLCYLALNAVLSCQLVAEEWSGYAAERKFLRVSHPKGRQRSSYYLSMPLKYGTPLLAANATLHWLVSQSTFVVNTTTFFPNLVEDQASSFITTGYSVSATLASICFGVFMVLIFLANSFRKYPEGMPLVSTCSVAISAACHRPEEDKDAHQLPVQWGVVTDGPIAEANDDRDQEQEEAEADHQIACCSFTTYRFVRRPRAGEICFGITESDKKGQGWKWAQFKIPLWWSSTKALVPTRVSWDVRKRV